MIRTGKTWSGENENDRNSSAARYRFLQGYTEQPAFFTLALCSEHPKIKPFITRELMPLHTE